MSESHRMTCQVKAKSKLRCLVATVEFLGRYPWLKIMTAKGRQLNHVLPLASCFPRSLPSSLQMQLLSDVRLTHFLGPSCDAAKHSGDIPEGIASKLPAETQDSETTWELILQHHLQRLQKKKATKDLANLSTGTPKLAPNAIDEAFLETFPLEYLGIFCLNILTTKSRSIWKSKWRCCVVRKEKSIWMFSLGIAHFLVHKTLRKSWAIFLISVRSLSK